jgi:sphinganine C4-monooxygenase
MKRDLLLTKKPVLFHSRHHRLYVPYAYGALYNHPVEGFMLDTLGTGCAYLISGMSVRQSMWFFTGSTIKTVDDHCGYALPFDPLQFITSNNAAYHDIHHQSWGIKTNFSQPFFTFWDRLLGTKWTGDIKLRYERGREAAKRAVEKDQDVANAAGDNATETEDVLSSTPLAQRRTPRKKRSSISEQSGSLKGLRDRVNQNLQGKGRSVLGVESSR